MPRVAQLGDRVFFGLCALAGALILVGSVLPAFELYLNASIGTGEAQRFLEYERELRLVTYLEPDTLLFPLVGAAFVVLGAAGTVVPRSWMAVTALLLTVPAGDLSLRRAGARGVCRVLRPRGARVSSRRPL
jgi:hypothetical protein